MSRAFRILLLAALGAPDVALAQTAAEVPRQAQPGFFRPAADPSLNPVPTPRANPATPASDGQESRRAADSLERIESSIDRLETNVARATARPAPLPPIASPLDGTAPILSPLDGTAPLVTPTNR